MKYNHIKEILYKKTEAESKILSLIQNEDLTSDSIESILKDILLWKQENDKWVIKSEEFIYSGENIMLSKHHRFIPIPKHRHDFIEFSYIYSGTLTQIIDGKKIILEEGETFLLDTNVEHSLEAANENDIIINILMRKDYFDTSLFSRLASNDIICDFLVRAVYDSKNYNNYCIFYSKKNEKIKMLIENLVKEYYNRSICHNEIIDCYIILIFSELLEVYKNQSEDAYISSTKASRNNIAEILKYIESNYLTVTLTSVANKFHFHPNYLSNIIKKSTGKSFKEIIHTQKLKQAESLLKNTDINIEEISIKVGYTNQTYFYKKFKKLYGLTPQQYRNRFKNLGGKLYG